LTYFLDKKPKKYWTLTPKFISYEYYFLTHRKMSRLTAEHALEVLQHLEQISAILELYKSEVEPYDQVDQIRAKAADVREIIQTY